MTDTFGFSKLRGRLSDTTKKAIQNIQDAEKLVNKAEIVAGDSAERVNNLRVIEEKLTTAYNNIAAILLDIQVEQAKSTEAAELAIDTSIDAVRLAKNIQEFKTKGYDQAVALMFGLMNEPYILAMILENDESIKSFLDKVGIEVVQKWLDSRIA